MARCRRERQLLALLDAEQRDVIVICGDTVTWGRHPYDQIRTLLSRLHAPLRVWLAGLNDPSSGRPNSEATLSTPSRQVGCDQPPETIIAVGVPY